MNLFTDLQQLIKQYLAPHRRRQNRLVWLTGLIDLESAFGDFFEWRNKYRYKTRVTSQIFVLENHLSRSFSPYLFAVRNYPDNFVPIGNNDEDNFWIALGTETTGKERYLPFALTDENPDSSTGDFYVEISGKAEAGKLEFVIPEELTVRIRAEIEKYKLADKKFNIIVKTIKPNA